MNGQETAGNTILGGIEMSKKKTGLELLASAKNVVDRGEEVYNIEGKEMKLPTFTIVETAESWNAMAERINIQFFISKNGYEPKDYEEVKDWMESEFGIKKFREEYVNGRKKETIVTRPDGTKYLQVEL